MVYVDGHTDTSELGRWVLENCTIASGAQIQDLAKRFAPGIGRRLEDPPPRGLSPRNKELVYRLSSDDFFRALDDHRTLCFARHKKSMQGTATPNSLKVFVKKPE